MVVVPFQKYLFLLNRKKPVMFTGFFDFARQEAGILKFLAEAQQIP